MSDGHLFSVGLDFVGELDDRKVSDELRDEFREHGQALTSQAHVEVKQAEKEWTIVDSTTYLVRNENQALNVYPGGLSPTELREGKGCSEFHELARLVRQREAILVIGPAVSEEVGMPTEEDLLAALCAFAQGQGNISIPEQALFYEAASIVVQEEGKATLKTILDDAFKDRKKQHPKPHSRGAYRLLPTIARFIPLLVTTNWDGLVSQTLRHPVPILKKLGMLPRNKPPVPVIELRGRTNALNFKLFAIPPRSAPGDPLDQPLGDTFSCYETGLERLLEELGNKHDRYEEVLLFQSRLLENMRKSRLHGDTPTKQSERSEIILELNRLTLSKLDVSFNELCGLPSPPPQDETEEKEIIDRFLTQVDQLVQEKEQTEQWSTYINPRSKYRFVFVGYRPGSNEFRLLSRLAPEREGYGDFFVAPLPPQDCKALYYKTRMRVIPTSPTNLMLALLQELCMFADRQEEQDHIFEDRRQIFEFYGDFGSGKSALLDVAKKRAETEEGWKPGQILTVKWTEGPNNSLRARIESRADLDEICDLEDIVQFLPDDEPLFLVIDDTERIVIDDTERIVIDDTERIEKDQMQPLLVAITSHILDLNARNKRSKLLVAGRKKLSSWPTNVTTYDHRYTRELAAFPCGPDLKLGIDHPVHEMAIKFRMAVDPTPRGQDTFPRKLLSDILDFSGGNPRFIKTILTLLTSEERREDGHIKLPGRLTEQDKAECAAIVNQGIDEAILKGMVGQYLFSVGLDFAGELDKQEVSVSLREQFQKHSRVLTPQFQVKVDQAGSKWTIVDAETQYSYSIKREDQTLNVYDDIKGIYDEKLCVLRLLNRGLLRKLGLAEEIDPGELTRLGLFADPELHAVVGIANPVIRHAKQQGLRYADLDIYKRAHQKAQRVFYDCAHSQEMLEDESKLIYIIEWLFHQAHWLLADMPGERAQDKRRIELVQQIQGIQIGFHPKNIRTFQKRLSQGGEDPELVNLLVSCIGQQGLKQIKRMLKGMPKKKRGGR